MTKKIQLTQGKVALVDDDDYEKLTAWKWKFDGKYASRHQPRCFVKRKTIRMHVEIMKTPDGMDTDHINGNKLDNRKCNLRVCTRTENHANKSIGSRNTSGYKGVSFDSVNKKWTARIKFGVINKFIGRFPTAKEAAIAYNKCAEKISPFIKKNPID